MFSKNFNHKTFKKYKFKWSIFLNDEKYPNLSGGTLKEENKKRDLQ
jgi:hypothetical protein